ncbi:hypothetical protein [Amycolatopsis thermoflava]|uniref:hypothetical protein n=1 Tax=Amycolatopsis thermoflava TaxID=84480 RepID=UPI003EBB6731
MAQVQLNEIPATAEDLEDYVAALFQSAGYFVEKNLTERDPGDILELDVVATNYETTTPVSTLGEVKGGKWGYPDIFKLLGWMTYLDKDRGAFFVKTGNNKDVESVASKLAPQGIQVVCFEDFSESLKKFENAGLGRVSDEKVVDTWRFSYLIERKLAHKLATYTRSTPESQGAQATLEYARLVNDGIFFTKSEETSLQLLYAAYQDHPKLALAAAHEMEGNPYTPNPPSGSPKLKEALYEGKHPLLQACLYTEHRARLALLRAGVDICCKLVKDLGRPPTESDWEDLDLRYAPYSFQQALKWLAVQPTFHRYALLWQQFLWNWGGMIFTDRIQDEYEWMASDSGVPIQEIPSALTAFDRFFPLGFNNSWLKNLNNSVVKAVVLLPPYFRGIGAYRRNLKYNWMSDANRIGTFDYTAHLVVTWTNSTVQFLT